MINTIKTNLEVVESMLYYWSAVVDKEKVNESFFVDVANMEAMKLAKSENFNEESIRKVLSSIQNRELLSAATKEEKRFWSYNMWIAEDVSLASKMAQPVKLLNVDDLAESLNTKFPNSNVENITIHITPLHLQPYYIKDNNLLINFFSIYFNENDEAMIDGKLFRDYIIEKLEELLSK